MSNKNDNNNVLPSSAAVDSESIVTVIDLNHPDEDYVIQQITQACETVGFFQIINHGVSSDEINRLRDAMTYLFDLPQDVKNAIFRSATNSRGYFNNELTKQRRDWKEAYDVGVPGSRSWNVLPDDDPANACLDGYNQFPSSCSEEKDNQFRQDIVDYFHICEELSHRVALLMSAGLQRGFKNNNDDEDADVKDGTANDDFISQLKQNHTSFLRLNYYPPYNKEEEEKKEMEESSPPLGISPHRDAGFLTVLLQDDDCHSLQVYTKKKQGNSSSSTTTTKQQYLDSGAEDDEYEWITVNPVKGAFTINTGDMCCIWSNGRYKAPLHRVLTNDRHKRYSAPFFYNPPYESCISPAYCTKEEESSLLAFKHACNWGYFRAVRFAGDLMDFGTEIQISDYIGGDSTSTEDEGQLCSSHITMQREFLNQVNFHSPFDVDMYRSLLQSSSATSSSS